MNQNHKTSNTMLVLAAGAALGALAYLLLPRKHKDQLKNSAQAMAESLREAWESENKAAKLKSIFNENTARARAVYEDAKASLYHNLREFSDRLESIDEEKYRDLVDDTVNYVQDHYQLPKEKANKLRRYLTSDFDRLATNV